MPSVIAELEDDRPADAPPLDLTLSFVGLTGAQCCVVVHVANRCAFPITGTPVVTWENLAGGGPVTIPTVRIFSDSNAMHAACYALALGNLSNVSGDVVISHTSGNTNISQAANATVFDDIDQDLPVRAQAAGGGSNNNTIQVNLNVIQPGDICMAVLALNSVSQAITPVQPEVVGWDPSGPGVMSASVSRVTTASTNESMVFNWSSSAFPLAVGLALRPAPPPSPILIDSDHDVRATTGSPQDVTLSFAGLTGNNCVVVVYGVFLSQPNTGTMSATWKGGSVTSRVAANFGGNLRCEIFMNTLGNILNDSGDVVLSQTTGGSDVSVGVCAHFYKDVNQASPIRDTRFSEPGSAGTNISVTLLNLIAGDVCTGIAGVNDAGVSLAPDQASIVVWDPLGPGGGMDNASGGLSGETATAATQQLRWTWGFNQNRVLTAIALQAASINPPLITSVTGSPGLGRFLNGDTSVPVTGINMAPTGTTEFWYADGKVFASATKEQQTISGVTATTLTIDTVTTGAVGDGANYLFVVVDAGGSGETVSEPFPVTAGLRIRQALTDNETGAVLRFGREVFSASDDFNIDTQTAFDLTATTDLTPGTRKQNHKVVSGVLTVMSAPEITAADAKFPVIFTQPGQFTLDVRDPLVTDDIDRKFFPAAHWLETGSDEPFVLTSNAAGAADWLSLGGAVPTARFTTALRTTSLTLPSSPMLVDYDGRTGQTAPPSEPVAHSAGTFTPLVAGKYIIEAEFAYTISTGNSSHARAQIALYRDVNAGAGPYTLVSGTQSTSRRKASHTRGFVSMEYILDVATTDRFRIYMWQDSGSSVADARVSQQRATFMVLGS